MSYRLLSIGTVFSVLFLVTATPGLAQGINRVKVTADHNGTWKTSCPATIHYTGVIHVTGPGSLSYHWQRSDGAHGPQTEANISQNQREITVHETWEIGRNYRASETLVVGRGNQHMSGRSGVTNIVCNK